MSCTHGNRYIRLDMCQDHGVYSKEIPVMTCNDYKIDENIFSFGLCGNSKYEPVYSETAPPPAKQEWIKMVTCVISAVRYCSKNGDLE